MSKKTWFYRLVIAALYLSALEQLLRGILRSIEPSLEIFLVVGVQAPVYVAPLILAWYGTHDRRFVLLLGLAATLVLFYPMRSQGDLLSYLLGFKFYLACLFYIPIIRYLAKYPGFEKSFLRHVFYILTAYAVWATVELFSTTYAPSIALRMKGFALFETQRSQLGRPLGMALDYQTGALAVALLCIILLLQKRYVWYFLLLALSYLIGLRTWFVAAVITSLLIMVKRTSVLIVLKEMRVRKPLWMLCTAVFLVGLYFAIQDPLESYMLAFTSGGSGGRIFDLLLNDGWFLFTDGGLLPNGFVRLGNSPIFGEVTASVSQQFLTNEVAILRIHYQMGGIATSMWLLIMYYPFLSKGRVFYRNHYLIILFFSFVGFAHHLTIFMPFTFIFFLFCSIQSRCRQELPRNVGPVRLVGRSSRSRSTNVVGVTA